MSVSAVAELAAAPVSGYLALRVVNAAAHLTAIRIYIKKLCVLSDILFKDNFF